MRKFQNNRKRNVRLWFRPFQWWSEYWLADEDGCTLVAVDVKAGADRMCIFYPINDHVTDIWQVFYGRRNYYPIPMGIGLGFMFMQKQARTELDGSFVDKLNDRPVNYSWNRLAGYCPVRKEAINIV